MTKEERNTIKEALDYIEDDAANTRESNTAPGSGEWGHHEEWKRWKALCSLADRLRTLLGMKPKKRPEE